MQYILYYNIINLIAKVGIVTEKDMFVLFEYG